MNDELDDLLQSALARSQPPADLSARVMRRVAREHSRRNSWRAIAVAAAGLVLSVSGYLGYQRLTAPSLQPQNPERQLVFALRLTTEKIAAVDARLKRSSPQLQLPARDLPEER